MALWQTVTVAFACSSSSAIGLPTVLLRPMTTACLPRRATPVLSISFMQPYGVQGRSRAAPSSARRRWRTEKPSTSLAARWPRSPSADRCAWATASAPGCRGSTGSALSAAMRASSAASAQVGVVLLEHRVEAGVVAGLDLVAHVDRAGRVVADQYRPPARADAARLQRRGALGHFAAHRFASALPSISCAVMAFARCGAGGRVAAASWRARQAFRAGRRARSSAGRRRCWRSAFP